MERLLTIVGPTAVGKTDLTLRLAEQLNGAVISGDAYQVYRGFDIGTAKPTAQERAAVPHYLIDILDGDESYNVCRFQQEVKELVTKLGAEGRLPILSGGTGLYVQAVVEGYDFSETERDEETRQRLQALFDAEGIEGLRAYAQSLADKEGIVLNFWDTNRLCRAIECLERGDTEALTVMRKQGLCYEGAVIGLRRPREELYERINRRVDLMMEQGLVEEVKQLLTTVPDSAQAFTAIGYKEVVAHLKGECDEATMVELIKRNTRRFAKRQLTWYKRMDYIQWLDVNDYDREDDLVAAALKLWEASTTEGLWDNHRR